jgi:hypothetical protein
MNGFSRRRPCGKLGEGGCFAVCKEGIVNGKDGLLDPTGTATRAEMAAALQIGILTGVCKPLNVRIRAHIQECKALLKALIRGKA